MRPRPLVIELVGPAGAGKTTLTRLLEAQGHAVRGTIWAVPRRQLARSAVHQLPKMLAWYRDTGTLLWDEMKHLARLDGLYAVLRGSRGNGCRLVLLDEGPVYTLSWLQVIGHARFRAAARDPWWHDTLRRWAAIMDAVVVLDAPDPVLASRIRERDKPHLMKDRSEGEVAQFAAAYRAAFDRVLVDFAAAGGPPVLVLGNGGGSPAERGHQLFRALAGAMHVG